MKDHKNMCPIKTRHEKSRRIIYEFSYKMGVLHEKRCKQKYNMISLDYHFTEEGHHIRRQKYWFELIMDKPPL